MKLSYPALIISEIKPAEIIWVFNGLDVDGNSVYIFDCDTTRLCLFGKFHQVLTEKGEKLNKHVWLWKELEVVQADMISHFFDVDLILIRWVGNLHKLSLPGLSRIYKDMENYVQGFAPVDT